MNILGLTIYGTNPAAAILVDGDLKAFCEEERFTRVKIAPGAFPSNAIKYCLNRASISYDEIDYISVGWDCNKYPIEMLSFFEEGNKKYKNKGKNTYSWEKHCLNTFTAENIENSIRDHFCLNSPCSAIPPIHFVNHHVAHAATAFFPSEFEDSAILVMDGSGEEATTSIFKGSGADIDLIHSHEIPNSLGWFYSAITQYLGFRANIGEGKVMGLAPYGNPCTPIKDVMDRIVRADGDSYVVDPFYVYYGDQQRGRGYSSKLATTLGSPRISGPFTQHHKDVAYAAQNKLEEIACLLAKSALDKTVSENLCLAGGVALNCKMNGVIKQFVRPKNMFIQPISSDSGVALGSALWLFREITGLRSSFRQKHTFFGPEFTNDDIEKVLRDYKLSYRRSDDIAFEASSMLAAGKIVSWFQGSMENGPRALGHRSVLAHPGFPNMKKKINAEVKYREMWRPFCPSVLSQHQSEWLLDSVDSPYMILAHQVNPDKKNAIPSVVHVDGSVRPQSVHEEIDPLYYRLISEFYSKTNIPMLLNTSLNIMGEPIICNPSEAIRCFYSTGLDVLAIGDFILEKQ